MHIYRKHAPHPLFAEPWWLRVGFLAWLTSLAASSYIKLAAAISVPTVGEVGEQVHES